MSESLDNGVLDYIKCTATVAVHFPVDTKGIAHMCCDQCRYYSMSTHRCRLTDCVCEFPARYVGTHCPLEIDRGGNNG